MKLSTETIFRKEFDGTAVILRLSDGKIFHLNPVSTVICEMLEKDSTKEQIMEELQRRVKDLPATATNDVDAFIAQLQKENMLV